MRIEIFDSILHVREFSKDIDIEGDKLYILLKEKEADEKISYEYLGSMLSTLEDSSTDFLSAFLTEATHYAVSTDTSVSKDVLQLKKQLDENDRSLVFEAKEEI